MNEIKKLWDELKNMLHHGPSLQPLWQAIIDQMHAFEARLATLETGLEDRVRRLLSGAELALQADFDAMKAEYASVVAALEARIAAIEGHPTVAIPPLTTETAPAPAPAASTETAPTEQIIYPDETADHVELSKILGGDQFENKQPAADGAKVSSGDDKAATPSVQPSLEAAGQTQGENHG
jgi:hypothetical protein